MYMYGPSADALFAVVKPHLLGARFLKGIEVTLRYGPGWHAERTKGFSYHVYTGSRADPKLPEEIARRVREGREHG
jgi:hypothetical protein